MKKFVVRDYNTVKLLQDDCQKFSEKLSRNLASIFLPEFFISKFVENVFERNQETLLFLCSSASRNTLG